MFNKNQILPATLLLLIKEKLSKEKPLDIEIIKEKLKYKEK